MTRLRTLRGYTSLARYLATISADPVAWISRDTIKHVPSPYSYAPSVPAFRDALGRLITWRETRHAIFEVYLIPASTPVYPSSAKADAAYLRSLSHA